MTIAAAALLAVAALAAIVDWAAVAGGRRAVELVSKPAVIAALIVAALLMDPPNAGERAWFVAALVASLAGDVALLVRGPAERRAFAIGLGCFLVAHLAYIAAFVGEQRTPGGLAVGAVFVWLADTIVGSRIVRGAAASRAAGLDAPGAGASGTSRGWRLGVAVAVYLLVISVMTAAAAGIGDVVAAAGAVAFFVSDGLLGWDRFVAPLPGGRLPRRIAYHLGQALLVLSLLA